MYSPAELQHEKVSHSSPSFFDFIEELHSKLLRGLFEIS